MPQDPLQPIFDEISKLLQFAEENANKSLEGPVDPEIEKTLEKLEELTAQFKEISRKELEKQGAEFKGPLEASEIVKKYNPKEQQLLRQGLDLGLNAMVMAGALKQARKLAGKSKEREKEKNTKKNIQQRRRRFKGMGGHEKWKKT